jgi:DsbE subfamily thiol:disulfide oxidoreductase
VKRAGALILVGVGLVLISIALIAFTGEGTPQSSDSFLDLRSKNSSDGEESAPETSNERDSTVDPAEIPTAPETGAYAPNFNLESTSGNVVQLSDYQGKVVLLNFWAVWCPPCIQEMPLLQRVHETYGDRLVVLAVNAGDTRETAVNFLESNGLSFEALLDSENKVDSQYRVRGLPTTFFIDSQGIIQFMHVGALQEGQIEEYLVDMGLSN